MDTEVKLSVDLEGVRFLKNSCNLPIPGPRLKPMWFKTQYSVDLTRVALAMSRRDQHVNAHCAVTRKRMELDFAQVVVKILWTLFTSMWKLFVGCYLNIWNWIYLDVVQLDSSTSSC